MSADFQHERDTISQLQGEIGNLRKSFVKQLTTTSRLTQALFKLDTDYFGGRFQGTDEEAGADPFRDLNVANSIVDALTDELKHKSAFAESPILRDRIADLITNLESVRSRCLNAEDEGATCVGLPPASNVFEPRSFPEGNALACISEAAGMINDVHQVVARAADRFKACRMMLADAEAARQDEEETHSRDRSELVSAMREELAAKEAEGLELRQALEELRQSSAAATPDSSTDNGAALRRTQEEHDRAEVRSLAIEVLELLGAGIDDEALREMRARSIAAIEDESDIGAICAICENTCAQHATAIADQLQAAATRRADDDQADQAATRELRSELDQARGEVARLQKELDTSGKAARKATNDAENVQQELDAAHGEVERLRKELDGRAEAVRKVTSESKALHEQLDAARDEVERLQAELDASSDTARKASGEVDGVRRDLIAAQNELERLHQELATRDEALRAAKGEAGDIQADLDAARAEVERLRRDLEASGEAVRRATSEAGDVRTELAGELERIRNELDASETERQRLESELLARAEALDAARAQLDSSGDDTGRLQDELAATKTRLDEALGERSRLDREREALDEQRAKVEEELATLRRATDCQREESAQEAQRLAGELDELRSEHERLQRRLSESSKDIERHAEKAHTLDEELAQARQERNDALRRVHELEERLEAAGNDLTQARTEVDEIRQRAEAAESDAARSGELQAELEAARAEERRATQELDGIRDELDRARKHTAELEGDTEGRLAAAEQGRTEAERQLADLRESHRSLENELADLRAGFETQSGSLREFDQLRSRFGELEEEARGLRHELQQRTDQRDIAHRRIEDLKHEIDQLEAAKQELTQQIQVREAEHRDQHLLHNEAEKLLRDENDQLRKRIERLESTGQKAERALAETRDEASTVAKERAAFEQQLVSRDAAIGDLEATVHKLRGQLEDARKTTASEREQRERAGLELTRQQAQLDAISNQFAEQRVRNADLERQSKDACRERDDIRDERDTLVAQVEDLRRKLADGTGERKHIAERLRERERDIEQLREHIAETDETDRALFADLLARIKRLQARVQELEGDDGATAPDDAATSEHAAD